MNLSSYPPTPRHSGRRFGLQILIISILLVLVSLAAWVFSLFHLSPEIRLLRDQLTRAGGPVWRQQIALNANLFTLGAIRTGLSGVRLDPAARAALQSVHAAGVAVYQLPPEAPPLHRVPLLAVADTVMADRGWDRVVLVMNAGNLVAIYTPKRNRLFHHLKCCVLVCSGRELVLLSVQGNPEPLVGYALAQADAGVHVPRLAPH